ncbi:hypothetical protein [Virgibacillus pantothenticus]|uniref:hypothetical protein n=1 Tax=Virgibacillus pantothenticus TaxID=1473 RepID=UPI00147A7459|nr:hypothetical protein [Virgibacillus pantothenticus]
MPHGLLDERIEHLGAVISHLDLLQYKISQRLKRESYSTPYMLDKASLYPVS